MAVKLMRRRRRGRRESFAKAKKDVRKARVRRKVRLPVDVYEEWLQRQTPKPSVPRKPTALLPLDSYEAWIRKQVVRPIAGEVKPAPLPLDSYEQWIRQQVHRRLKSVTHA